MRRDRNAKAGKISHPLDCRLRQSKSRDRDQMHPMFPIAQSIMEYGMASLKTHMQLMSHSIRDWFNNATPITWLTIGAVVIVVVWLWGRR